MGAIDEFADDVNGIVADIEAQFKVLGDRKRQVQERGNEIAHRWAVYFDTRDQALTQAEAALNRISNVPLTEVKPAGVPSDVGLTALPKVNP
ncbi:MAG: hypothetical protein KGL35_24840 [Bradyrhizobium sp.]|nr:hypothetical protein [Bradyrhizobium sp.]